MAEEAGAGHDRVEERYVTFGRCEPVAAGGRNARQMRISFDLDDTLICYLPGVPGEAALPWYWRALVRDEPLRRGARALTARLWEAGWEVWVYTTSHRHPAAVRWWLWCHGIRVDRVINQDV